MPGAEPAARPLVRVFAATSLDGFLAREDGRIDWLEQANGQVPPGEDLGFAAFLAETDVLVMGRVSFATVLGFPAWPYGEKPVIVVTHRPEALRIPGPLRATVSGTSEAPQALIARLAARGVRRVYLDGGGLIRSFLAEDLVDEITETRIPVLLGSGRPLFGGHTRDLWFELASARSYDPGLVQVRYVRSRS